MSRKGYDFPDYVKEEARKRARYSCERCGRKGHTEIHHRIPVWFAKNHPLLSPALITSLQNARALCPSCHNEEDRENRDFGLLAQSIFGAIQLKLL